MMRWFALSLFLLAPSALAQTKPKEAPDVKYSVPLAVQMGTKTKLVLRGKLLDGVKSVSCSEKTVTVKLVGEGKKVTPPNNYPAEKLAGTEITIELDIPKELKAESISLMVKDKDAESTPYKLSVASKLTNEVEPNDGFEQAEKLTLPATIEGVLQKERDIDLFRVEGKKGQELSVTILAAKLGSPADVMLTLYGSNKQIVKIVDDSDMSADPAFTIKLPADGTYYITVMEANDLGGAQFGYRLLVK